MLFHKDILSGIALLILCLIGTMSVCQLPAAGAGEAVGPATLPKFCLMVLALFAGILIIRGIRLNGMKKNAGFNFCLRSIVFLWVLSLVSLRDGCHRRFHRFHGLD